MTTTERTGPGASATGRIAALVVNYRTPELTAEACASCVAAGLQRILVVDNASTERGAEQLKVALGRHGPAVEMLGVDWNSGFAGGVNLGIAHLRRWADWDHLLLLNSDAHLTPFFPRLWRDAASGGTLDFVGGRVDRSDGSARGSDTVESIGMTLHRSLIASELRERGADPLLGPTGAFAILSRRMLDELHRIHGEILSSAFFCYAEDTDLCVRARLLGYEPTMLGPEPSAVHAGQASSGGKDSDFVFFHGIRNTLWMQVRSIPAYSLVRCLPWMIAAQLGILVRALVSRRFGLLLRIHLETIAALPRLLRERRRIQSVRAISPRRFHSLISRRLYDEEYIERALRDISLRRTRR